MERTIRVTGKGKLSVKPDTIRLRITQESMEETYEGAIRESAEQKEDLNRALKKLGFEKTELKTLSFHVDTEYERYQAKDKSWKNRLLGYRFTHLLKLEFKAGNEMLGRVLFAVARCPGHPQFSIEYTVADREAAKNELLAKAVGDSRTKAEVLSRAAGVKLQSILSIDYSWGEIDFVSRPVNGLPMDMCCELAAGPEKDAIGMEIEPDDIDVEDTVTVVWEIQ